MWYSIQYRNENRCVFCSIFDLFYLKFKIKILFFSFKILNRMNSKLICEYIQCAFIGFCLHSLVPCWQKNMIFSFKKKKKIIFFSFILFSFKYNWALSITLKKKKKSKVGRCFHPRENNNDELYNIYKYK